MRGLTSPRAIRAFFDDVRLTILERILNNARDGYRRNDALYLIGEICWRDGRPIDAVRIWRGMIPASGDVYFPAASALRELLARIATAPAASREIDGILAAQQGRWLMFSFDRLKQFGYRFSTF